ncbi:YhcN/YlaJ family sporulation lipoprotein [Cohnella cholangitidis]|uniref:YhcN/YlaJ family sporulation lipoprotein n=1 Tax=Cohnella cholangitidis TaxID=2598458 RepID=A0A7G5C173_9BACL|nr:YhcN/YlaJ family sporulation lipoprotein [Cohnella cholangitidis]QMV42957.1 hypothetical protein FPL14_18515 [Cohnella cholangitidis]
MFKRCTVMILSVALCFSLAGCTKTNQYKARSTEHRNVIDGAHPNANKRVSEKIAKDVSSVKGISKATVVVHNRDVIIGLDVKGGENAAAVEQKVVQAAHKSEPGYTVHVTAERGLHTRIQNLHSQMLPLDGHPVRNFTEDVGILIQDIGNRVTRPLR